VAILAENSCVWVVAHLGTLAHGAIAVPPNTRHSSGDLDRVEIIHGSGSPAAEWLQMYREHDLDRAAKHVDGLVMGR
jgi:acyl-CoA synthetase (AMP-forming)/AMP-acid ligase II